MTQEIEEEARKYFKNVTTGNTILVGIVLSVIGVTPEKIAEAAEAGREEVLKKGFDLALRWNITGKFPVSAKAACHCKFDGNQALALGAILGGCQFMASYPMTPAKGFRLPPSISGRSIP